ncbi:hypothetical protein OROHE_008141 [Orobanche hederae]
MRLTVAGPDKYLPLPPATTQEGGRRGLDGRKKKGSQWLNLSLRNYQISNGGNFPSLNLTHKVVGGSFYTVREIVREIIQENRVLAPPKVPSEEYSDPEFLEQHLMWMEPEFFLSGSDEVHTAARIVVPLNDQIPSEENISSSKEQSDNEQIEGVIKVAEKDEGCDRTSIIRQAPNHYQINNNEKTVNGIEENPHFDKPVITNIDCQENNDSDLLSSLRLTNEHCNKNDQTVIKNKEFGGRIRTKSTVTKILDKEEKYGAQYLEASRIAKSRRISDVVVETFPLRPVPRTIHGVNGESDNLQEEADGALEAIQSSSGAVNDMGKEKEKLTGEKTVPDISDIKDLESEDTLPVGIEASSSTVGRKANSQDTISSPKENSPTLDRINLEIWEGTSKKSTRHDSNPLLAFVKSFISSFAKLWT